MATTDGSTDSRLDGQVRALEAEVERYRRASEAALQLLDWCIDYLHDCGEKGIARGLATNRSHIRLHLRQRSEQPVARQSNKPADG